MADGRIIQNRMAFYHGDGGKIDGDSDEEGNSERGEWRGREEV
jgi:hypothetical protein